MTTLAVIVMPTAGAVPCEAQGPRASTEHARTRATIDRLPIIDFARQCVEAECDRTIEDSVFTVLERVIPRVVTNGLTRSELRARLGPAPTSYGPVEHWRRASDGARVERWTLARSLSGTGGYFVVLVNGRVAHIGRASVSWLDAHFGRPGPRA